MTKAASARRRSSYAARYSDYEEQAARQAKGLDALFHLAADDRYGVRDAPAVYAFPARVDRPYRGDDARDSDRRADFLPPRAGRDGYLARDYDIPEITFRPRRWLAALPVVLIVGGSLYLHQAGFLSSIIADPTLLATWLVTLIFVLIQLVLAWSQKPVSVNQREQQELDRLYVTVVIPCYNEDAQILDRTIVSLMRQTRLPNHIEVVDDGSTVNYAHVRDFWFAHHPAGVRFSWVRQQNAGKKHAQAVTFTTDHDAHIFVTIDSDSALDRRAIDEGLKPFADPRVVSVAGLETAINIDRNLLTRAIGHRSLVFQLFAMSAQSVARGSVLINPGAFSLYWAPLIRKIVPAYIGETFFGVPVTLGDDTALTMYALLHGRAVHQPTAVSMPVYPETLAHHLRQWTRWMRASTIRTLWRLRYLPVVSYGWIFTVYTIGSFLTSVSISLAIPLAWPDTWNLLIASLAAMVIWPVSIALRLATVQRSDQGTLSRLIGVALLPAAALWYVTVLRQIRFYGIATCWRQGWVTRQKVEVRLDSSHEKVAGSESAAPEADWGARDSRPRPARDVRDVHEPWDVRERVDARGLRAAAQSRWDGMSPPGDEPWNRRNAQRHPAQDPRLGPGRNGHARPQPPRMPAYSPDGFAEDVGLGRDLRLPHDNGLIRDPRLAQEAWVTREPHGQQAGLPRDLRHPQTANGARDPRVAPYPAIAQDPRLAAERPYSEDRRLAHHAWPAYDSWFAGDRQPSQGSGLVRDTWPAERRSNGLNPSSVPDDWAVLDSRIQEDAPYHRRHHTAEPYE
jgi:hyaluronan synthase